MSLISSLPDVLTWSDTGLLHNLELVLLDRVTADLGFALGRLAGLSEGAGQSTIRELRDLPDISFARVLIAPEVYFRLHHVREARGGAEETRAFGSFLADGLEAERRLAGQAGEHRAVWTALGDWYFPPGTTAADLRPGADPLVWESDAVYRAPRLTNGATVDFMSPFGRGKLPELSGEDVPFSPAGRRRVLARIEASIGALSQSSPTAARFVADLSKVILPRRDPGRTREYRAASTRLCIGRPVFRNPDVPGATTAEIVDGLVHETIHCVIDIIELTEPFVPDAGALPTTILPSPWTGRLLDLNTYLQACFVWYGLWNLWSQALDSDSFEPRLALRYVGLCGHGFTSADITDGLLTVRDTLAPGLLDALAEMQTRARAGADLLQDALMDGKGTS